jgi:hypothetical protein
VGDISPLAIEFSLLCHVIIKGKKDIVFLVLREKITKVNIASKNKQDVEMLLRLS